MQVKTRIQPSSDGVAGARPIGIGEVPLAAYVVTPDSALRPVPLEHQGAVLDRLGFAATPEIVALLNQVVGALPNFSERAQWDNFCFRCWRGDVGVGRNAANDEDALRRLRWLLENPDLTQSASFYWRHAWRPLEIEGRDDVPEPPSDAYAGVGAIQNDLRRQRARESVHRLQTKLLALVGRLSIVVISVTRLAELVVDFFLRLTASRAARAASQMEPGQLPSPPNQPDRRS